MGKHTFDTKMAFRYTLLCMLAIIGIYGCVKASQKTKELSFGGISFTYPSDWIITTEDEDGSYFIKAKGKDDVLMVNYYPDVPSNQHEVLKTFLESIKDNDKDIVATSKPVSSSQFGKYKSLCLQYKMKTKGINIYGIAHALTIEGKTLLVVKQSDTEKRLERRYKTIEDSFHIAETVNAPDSETREG